MKLVQDIRANVSIIDFEGEQYTFDLGSVQAESAIGAEKKRYEATTMLARLVQLKGPVNTVYYQTKLAIDQEYWNSAPEVVGLVGKQKQTAKHAELWMQAHPSYCAAKEVRDFIEDTIASLTMVWIPRLRSFAESTQVGERETSGTVPPQDPFPPFGPGSGAR